MHKYEQAFEKLNDEQKAAVRAIDGPVLVVAGPGTGKTELLSVRVANILRSADVAPGNILCLTFTDNAARNMLERLEKLIGQPAYHVAIHTFHSFGSDIINQYPEFFNKRPLLQPVDSLGSYEILSGIFSGLSHSNPLSAKVGEDFVFLSEAAKVISWLKHNAVNPDELGEILVKNQEVFTKVDKLVASANWNPPSPKHLKNYQEVAKGLRALGDEPVLGVFSAYNQLMFSSLEQAIDSTDAGGRHAPKLTAWRNDWLTKQADGTFALKDSGKALKKLEALKNVYQKFQDQMAMNGLYDFDDMVMEVVHALETEEELRLNLQERFQYILVDEFQDTNKAQLRMLKALGDNPVNADNPNIMAVGDPNQAIYAFQGASTNNITDFLNSYKDIATIHLEKNYRSTQTVLDTAYTTLTKNDVSATKLSSESEHTSDHVSHNVFTSELDQYQWVAQQIKKHIKDGTKPEKIGVIAPRHKYLERLMPYLASQKLPVAYERRENILEAPVVLHLLRMAELVDALAKNQHDQADVLFSEVLNYNFFNLPSEDLLTISLKCYENYSHWQPELLKTDNDDIKTITNWFIGIAKVASTQPLEYVLDELSGKRIENIEDDQDEVDAPSKTEGFTSPLYEYYFGEDRLEQNASNYLTHLGQLSTLRRALRSWKPNQTLFTADLAEFVHLHTRAKLKLADTNPYTQSVDAVQVMTAYKAKGLEYDVVFAINAQDEVWGPKARSRSDTIRLPKNLPLKPAGDSEEDKLRLFYVALTRAKHTLHVTSYRLTQDSKLSLGLSFIGGNSDEAEPVHPALAPTLMPAVDRTAATELLSTDWAYRYSQIIADKPTLVQPILERYKLSVTHLNNFLDVGSGGPQHFLIHNLLRFPEAMSPSAAYGDAMHKTLQWAYAELKSTGELPAQKSIDAQFVDFLARKHLEKTEFNKMQKRGLKALQLYMAERAGSFNSTHVIERNFANEGVVVNGAHLGGKIDKIILGDGVMQVVDFKTGKPSNSWQGKDEFEKQKLHRYRRQLLFYKLLVENSAAYGKKFKATNGALEFLEADDTGTLPELLEMDFPKDEVEQLAKLIGIVWQKIMTLDFPDTSKYTPNLKGTLQFEEDLLKE